MKNHLLHHHTLTICAAVVAFVGLLIVKTTSGFSVLEGSSTPWPTKIVMAIATVLLAVVFFERTHHE